MYCKKKENNYTMSVERYLLTYYTYQLRHWCPLLFHYFLLAMHLCPLFFSLLFVAGDQCLFLFGQSILFVIYQVVILRWNYLYMIWKMHCWLGACLHDQSILVVWIEYIRQLSSVHWVGDGCKHFLDVGEGLLRGLYGDTSSRKLVKIVFHFREVSMSLTHKWLLVIIMFSIGASWDSCQYLF